jgi:aryl-alcohol dehydrogenase-like predicted oxidoreductase
MEDHVLDEDTVRKSVERSLKRFGTDYLDVVCAWPVAAVPPKS